LTRRAKIEKFGIYRGNFPIPNQRGLTRPEEQKIDPTRHGLKFCDPNTSLLEVCQSEYGNFKKVCLLLPISLSLVFEHEKFDLNKALDKFRG